MSADQWPLKAFRRMIFQFWAGIQMGTQKYQAPISACTLLSLCTDNFLLCCIALHSILLEGSCLASYQDLL